MRRLAILATTVLVTACGKKFPSSPVNLTVREPTPDSVESVVFLVGDAGMARLDASPLLTRLRNEVEQWSQRLARGGAVTVLFLGDNVYPVGVRDATDPAFPHDSTRLQSQIDALTGDHTRKQWTNAFFIAGNHDWGHMAGAPGRDRLFNQATFIARRSRAAGFEAALLPAPGDATVNRVDVGRFLRLLLIDSAWWMLEANDSEKARFLTAMEKELKDTDGRSIVIAAHHPWSSGASHGGLVPLWKGIGVRWLLNRSGAILQDINSLPYRALRNELNAMFVKYGRPLLWAGGHDHNLQVMKSNTEHEPAYDIVSGAGSKTSKVGPTPNTVFARSEPGFMRLVAMKDGAVNLFVVSAAEDFLECTGPAEAVRQCVEVGAREFRTVYSVRLR